MYLTSEAQALKHACTRFGLRLSRITPQGVKDFFHVCDLFLGDLMLRDRKETFSLVHVLSSFIQADRAATARATSRRENPDLDSRSQQCSHTTALAPRRRTARQQTLPTCHRELSSGGSSILPWGRYANLKQQCWTLSPCRILQATEFSISFWWRLRNYYSNPDKSTDS